ncbi:BRCA1-associated RING domain protein 1-like isoform X3 [Symsagittifera roscoffensis]|uniref:BRCA1-associated RING domain protein 1-like isoform X3 n=1 Tax=Symsagittifera roscoffensis TaxID=84072 RepID=UPI00307C30E0
MNHIKAYDTPDRAYDTRDSSMTINSSTVSSVSTGGKTLGFASSLHDIYTIGEVKSSSSKKIRHDRSSFDEKLSNGKMSITSSNLRRDKKTKSHKPKQNGWTKKGDHNNTVKEFGRTSKCSANIMPKENDQPKKCSSINMSDENDRRKNGNTNNKPKKRNHTKIKLPTKEYDCDAESAKCYFHENYNMMQGMERMNNTPEPSQEQLAAIIGLNFLEGLEVSVSEHVIKRVRVRDHRGETRLHRESRRGHLEKVKELLKMGADPNTMDNDNFTPLHEYKALENVEICRVLLEHGADPRKSGGMSEMTPLHVAVMYNYLDAIPLLIQHGADILATGMYDDGDLFTPLSFAKENGNGELVKLLKTEWNKYLRPKESDRIQFNHEVLTPIRKALRETNERLIKSDKAMKCVIKHIVVSALSAESQVLLNQFSTKFEIEVDRYFGDSCDALVVEKKSTGSYKRTSKLMTAIVNNGVVIDKGWIEDSLNKGKLLPCDDYLVDSFQPYKYQASQKSTQ